jgi:hypothetical protein
MSIFIDHTAESVIYPPEPGTPGGPCVEPCHHIDCKIMRQEAEKLCPVCGKPLGYGGVRLLHKVQALGSTKEEVVISMKHAECAMPPDQEGGQQA